MPQVTVRSSPSIRASFPLLTSIPVTFAPPFKIRQKLSQRLPKTECSGKQIWIFKNILLSHRRLWLYFMASCLYICYSMSQLFLTVPSEEIQCTRYLLLVTARSAKSPCKALSFLMCQDAFICATSRVYQIKHADSCVCVGFGTETAPNTDLLCVPALGCKGRNIR